MSSDGSAGSRSSDEESEKNPTDLPETAEADTVSAQQAADAEARRTLWPRVARRTRTQVIALVLISCLALGPAVALVLILRADPTPVSDLIPPPGPDREMTRVTATVTGLSPSAGELRTRISVTPGSDLIDSERLTAPLSVVVNGAVARSYQAGEAATPFEVNVPLTEGSTTRYPFDTYRGSLVIELRVESGNTETAQPFTFEARSAVEDFDLSADPLADTTSAKQSLTVINLTASRPATTTIYAIWLMVLMWGLAVTGLLIVWAVVIWTVDLPFWVFGYFVGVLFALPPLRDSLPGRPPPGTIFDFGSFYWAVTIIGVSLILLLSIWLHRTRAQQRLQALDPTRSD